MGVVYGPHSKLVYHLSPPAVFDCEAHGRREEDDVLSGTRDGHEDVLLLHPVHHVGGDVRASDSAVCLTVRRGHKLQAPHEALATHLTQQMRVLALKR